MNRGTGQDILERDAGGNPVSQPVSPPIEGAADDNEQELLGRLRQIESLLADIRGQVDATLRERRHREFSVARLTGALLQALVVGLVIAAVADWAYRADPAFQLVKLAFAGVLQLGALTAFVMSRQRS